METYTSKIASNDKVELIMASFDRDSNAALAWAKKHTFPWPTVMIKDQNKAGIGKYAGRGVPHYVLIDKEGKKLAENKAECFAKLAELSK